MDKVHPDKINNVDHFLKEDDLFYLLYIDGSKDIMKFKGIYLKMTGLYHVHVYELREDRVLSLSSMKASDSCFLIPVTEEEKAQMIFEVLELSNKGE